MGAEENLPRMLSELERTLLFWVLPETRPGYAEYRGLVEGWKVVGRGRRGEGNYILGEPGLTPDVESPLPHLFAYGSVSVGKEELTISVRERLNDQLEFEIAGPVETDLTHDLGMYRRWTFSEWLPSRPCPICSGVLREVEMKTKSGRALALAICAQDRRLWVFDSQSGVNHPIPVTGFYNELMLRTKTQNRREVPDSKRLFSDLHTHTDAALAEAFSSYNRLRTKVVLGEPLVIPTEAGFSWLKRIRRWFFKRSGGKRS